MVREVPADVMNSDTDPLAMTTLPPDLADAVSGLTPTGNSPETVADLADGFGRLLDGAGVRIGLANMFQPEETRHAVEFDGRVEHVPCVLDAVVVAFAVDATPVHVRSASPVGDDPVRLTVGAGSVDVSPATATFSLGVAESEANDPDLSVLVGAESVAMASCSYINAFQDASAYERWNDELAGAVAMPVGLDVLAAFAELAAEEWIDTGA